MKKLVLIPVTLTALGLAGWVVSFIFGLNARAGDPKMNRQFQMAANKAYPLPQPVRKVPVQRGLVIEADLDDPAAGLQKTVAQQLRRANLIPERRLAHFLWLDDPSVRVEGWHGRIEQMAQTPKGWVATIRVTPYVASLGGASTTILDYTLERYESVNGTLRFLGASISPDASSGSFITD